MESKESWVKSTMESMENMQRAVVSRQLARRILNSVYVKNNIRPIRPMVKWAVAASIILLVGFNVISIAHCARTSNVTSESNPVYKEYFSYLNDF